MLRAVETSRKSKYGSLRTSRAGTIQSPTMPATNFVDRNADQFCQHRGSVELMDVLFVFKQPHLLPELRLTQNLDQTICGATLNFAAQRIAFR